MSLDFWKTDSRRFRKLSPMSLFFSTMPDLDKHFAGLDAESMATLRRFIAKTHFSADSTHLYSDAPHYAFCWSGLCSQKEYDEAVSNEQELERLQARYHLQGAEVSSLIHHHGLKQLPEGVLQSLRGTIFIDAGAFLGDSTLVFLHYRPACVWAFEPSPRNQALFLSTMHANGVPDTAFRLISQGLSDQIGTIRFSDKGTADCSLIGKGRCKTELVPLDSLTPPTRIGLIKADLEGMGMSMLRGAVQTIRRDRPILSLSFYHNIDEVLNTYAFVRSLGIPYQYKVLSLCPPWENHDLTLLAWPANLP